MGNLDVEGHDRGDVDEGVEGEDVVEPYGGALLDAPLGGGETVGGGKRERRQ